jgi:hypothetical protein
MKAIEAILLVVGLLLLSAIIMGFPTMWLWNYVMPYVFGLTPINLYQAIAINFLSSILFKSNVSINNKKD